MSTAPLSRPGRPRLALAVVLFAAATVIMDISLQIIALPAIGRDLAPSMATPALVPLAFSLAFALGLLPLGRLGDLAGRRRVLTTGAAVWIVAGLTTALAPSIAVLLASRLLAGLAAAALLPQTMALASNLGPSGGRTSGIGLFIAATASGSILSPLLGGAVLTLDPGGLGWRLIFLYQGMAGLPILCGALLTLPASAGNTARPGAGFDGRGTLLFSLAILLLVVPLAAGRLAGWPAWIAVPMAAALPVALLLRRHLGRAAGAGRPQILPASLLRQPAVVGAVALTAVVFTTGPGAFAMLSTVLQAGVGFAPDRTGAILAAFPAGVLAASLVAARLGGRPIGGQLGAGALLFALGMLATRALLGAAAPTPLFFAAALGLAGLGMGALVNALFRAVMAASPPADHGAAAGVQQAFQQVGTALGFAVVDLVFQGARLAAIDEGATAAHALTAAGRAACLYPVAVFALLIAALSIRRLAARPPAARH
ncbi:MFS transporter [Pleomorphomonas koreensis]|uniref:MFS transporter n=1 Tax=Pleomorphomonas koreensis TaxID=257440 RepID=UPI0003F88A92|nr:MFS transporter [Pleomorphomonas koreensis]